MNLPSSTLARDRRAAFYLEKPDLFMKQLYGEIWSLKAQAQHIGAIPAVRANATSDLPWEDFHPKLFSDFSDVQFFDYTKVKNRVRRSGSDDSWATQLSPDL